MRRTTTALVFLLSTLSGCGSIPTMVTTDSTQATSTSNVSTSSTSRAETTAPTTGSSSSTAATPGSRRPDQPGEVVTVASVTDGDTIRVVVAGGEEPVRLIGINAPETDECMAVQATARLTELVLGETVTLVVDVSDRDQYDRLLRYVYVGDLFVNEVLVREGLAIARRYEPDIAMAQTLEAAQAAATADEAGMWASDACGAVAAGEIAIGKIRSDADGDDNVNLNDEWVELSNPGSGPLDLTGWSVKDESASHRFTFPDGFTLQPGATVRIHTGCGTDTDNELYWCNTGSAVWNNSGDTVFVLDPDGNIVVSESF